MGLNGDRSQEMWKTSLITINDNNTLNLIMFFYIHVNIFGPLIMVFNPIISSTIWMKNKRSSFTLEIQIEVTDFGGRK